MKSEHWFRLVGAVAAVHVAALSMFLGLRHPGYMLAATLSATVIWGGVFVLSGRKRRAWVIAGAVAGLLVQQVAYQFWNAELSGFWLPLAQFGALQFLVACLIGRAAR